MTDLSGLDFVTIDMETANADRASVCAVGLAVVRGGEVVAADRMLVAPPTGADSFASINVSLHGIDAAAVADAAGWEELLPQIDMLADALPLVAYNAAFERSVYERATEAVGLVPQKHDWRDALALVTALRPDITPPKLPVAAAALGVELGRHHDAEADAVAAAEIVIALAQERGRGTVAALWEGVGRTARGGSTARRRTAPDGGAGKGAAGGPAVRWTTHRVGDLPRPAAEADPSHPLAGQHVVVTGSVPGYPREALWAKLAEAGAVPQLNVTKATTMIVCAQREDVSALEQDDVDPEEAVSSKERKALEYAARGQQIRFLTAADLLALLEPRPVEDPGAVSRAAVHQTEAVSPRPAPPKPAPALAPVFDDEPIIPESLRRSHWPERRKESSPATAFIGSPTPGRPPLEGHLPAPGSASGQAWSGAKRAVVRAGGFVLIGAALLLALSMVGFMVLSGDEFTAGQTSDGFIGVSLGLVSGLLAWFLAKTGMKWVSR